MFLLFILFLFVAYASRTTCANFFLRVAALEILQKSFSKSFFPAKILAENPAKIYFEADKDSPKNVRTRRLPHLSIVHYQLSIDKVNKRNKALLIKFLV